MESRTRILLRAVAATAVVAGTLATAARAGAAPATFTVTTGTDAPDAVLDGTCASTLPGGPCTLRAAVQEANATVDEDLITIDASVDTLTLDIEGNDEDSSATGDLDVIEDLRVLGNYVTATTVTTLAASSAPTWTDRAVDVRPGARLSVEALRVTGFDLRSSDDSTFLGDGGAYRNAGSLDFSAANAPADQTEIDLVDRNFAFRGGAIYNAAGASLTISHDGPTDALLRLKGGEGPMVGWAGDAGGLVFNDGGTVTTTSDGGWIEFARGIATDSTSVGSRQQGGGIYSSGGTVSFGCFTHVTGNRADADGGGLYIAGGELQLTSGVVRENVAAGSGGGLYLAPGTTLRGLDNFACPGGYAGPVAFNLNRSLTGTGGGVHNAGTVLANRYFEFVGNEAGSDGGGLHNAAGATVGEATPLAGTDMRFWDNVSGRDGGGLSNQGTIDLDVVLDVRRNSAARNGGGLALFSPIQLGGGAFVQILENQAGSAGGGVYGESVSVELAAGVVMGNDAATGAGGLHQVGGSVLLADLTIRNNGGTAALELRNARGELTNVTVSEAQSSAVVVFADTPTPPSSISFTTIAGNAGAALVALGGGGAQVGASILAANGAGNCNVSGGIPGAFTSLGSSAYDDGSCDPVASDVVSGDASLLDPQDETSPIGTDLDGVFLVPQPQNPAIDLLPPGPCSVPVDQRGVSRPQGPACDAGSIEPAAATASISGTVLTAPTGSPAPAASTCVYVLDLDAVEPVAMERPDPGGAYTVQVPPGTYWVAFVPCDDDGEPVDGPFQAQWYRDVPFDLDVDDVDPEADGATPVEATEAGTTGIDACVAPAGEPRTCAVPTTTTTTTTVAPPPAPPPSSPTTRTPPAGSSGPDVRPPQLPYTGGSVWFWSALAVELCLLGMFLTALSGRRPLRGC